MPVDFTVLNEIFTCNLFTEFLWADKNIILTWFNMFLFWTGSMTSLLFKDSLKLLENGLYKDIFTDTRWAYYDERLLLLGGWVEWMEVFFSVNENVVL